MPSYSLWLGVGDLRLAEPGHRAARMLEVLDDDRVRSLGQQNIRRPPRSAQAAEAGQWSARRRTSRPRPRLPRSTPARSGMRPGLAGLIVSVDRGLALGTYGSWTGQSHHSPLSGRKSSSRGPVTYPTEPLTARRCVYSDCQSGARSRREAQVNRDAGRMDRNAKDKACLPGADPAGGAGVGPAGPPRPRCRGVAGGLATLAAQLEASGRARPWRAPTKGSPAPSATSFVGCGARAPDSSRSATSASAPRPSSRGRPRPVDWVPAPCSQWALSAESTY